jgi:predicted nucleic acid-binding protein
MRICLDTAILLDVLKDEYRPFQEMLYGAMEKGEELVAPTVVYAELIPQFREDIKSLRQFLREHKIDVLPLDIGSVTAAANAWLKYLKRRKRMRCPQCGYELQAKEHLLSDFYIGGFALARCDAILTRDRGIYRTYFPELKGYEGCLAKGPFRFP